MSIIQDSYYKKYRYSLRGDLGTLYISEPIGWDEDRKKFKRSGDVHGVFINLSNNLEFYIGDEENDGGYNYLKETYAIYGINAKVILIKEEDVSGTWIELYRGNFDFSTYTKGPYKISIMFNESGLYEKIKARNSEELEVDRLTTMDGTVIPEMRVDTVGLDGRKILIIDEMNSTKSANYYDIQLEGGDGGVLFFPDGPDIALNFSGSRDYGAAVIPTKMVAEQSGNAQTIYDYNCPANDGNWTLGNASSTGSMFYDEADNPKTLKISMDIQVKKIFSNSIDVMRVELVKYGGTLGLEILSQTTLIEAINPITDVIHSYKVSELLIPILTGESLSLVVHCKKDGTSPGFVRIVKADIIVYDETYADPSSAKFLLPFESLDRIINIITDEPNRLKSKALGRTDIGYANDGEASLTGLTNGFWVRQFNTEKITTSFQDFMDSFKAIWQLGYGIEKNGFDEIVRVEHISHFYQNVVTIRLTEQPSKITRKCAKEYFYSGLEIGYSQPSGAVLYEEALGLDEYNILNKFTTAITRIENKFISISKYRADSYGTEFARRKPKLSYPEEDTRYDLSVMVLDLKRGINNIFQQRKWNDDFVVPTPFNKFSTGIYSPETATNLRFSPMNTLLRWAFWIKGGFMKNLTEFVRYTSSNGNSSLITEIDKVGGVPRAENGNVLNSELDKNLFNPDTITFEYAIDEKLLLALNGKTLHNGEEIMNYYGLVEFINEEGDYEYGFLLSAEPNANGKFELLSSTKRISSVSSNTGKTSIMIGPSLLVTLNQNINEVILTWAEAKAQEGISHYRVYMDGKLVGNTLDNSTSYTIINVSEFVEHNFYVIGVTNQCRVTTQSNVATITLPTTPTSNNLDFNLNKYL